MAQHTPGPWVVDNPNDNLVARVEDGIYHYIADTAAPMVRRSYEECAANARLIAQSPRLLAACKKALAFVTDERWGTINYMETDKVYVDAATLADVLRDVIAAAEPESDTPCRRCGELRHPTDRPDGCRDPGCP